MTLMTKHFHPDGYASFRNDTDSTQRATGLTEWFDEEENDVNHVPHIDQIST